MILINGAAFLSLYPEGYVTYITFIFGGGFQISFGKDFVFLSVCFSSI